MPTKREIALAALIGLPIWWVGWHILDALNAEVSAAIGWWPL